MPYSIYNNLIYQTFNQQISIQYLNRMHNRENSEQFFEKYLNGSVEYENAHDQNISHRSQLHKEEIQMRVSRINMKLQNLIHQRLGDIYSPDPKELEKTLRVIESLLAEASRSQEAKTKLNSELRQLQNLNFNNINTIDKLSKDKTNLQNDRSNITQAMKQNQKKFKQMMDKSNQQKQQINKQLRQIQQREKTIETEFRKKDSLIKQYQEQIRKYQQEKPNYKNSLEIMHKFENGNSVINFSTNAENQYGQLAADSLERVQKKLINENHHLKECLTNIYRELNSVLELKKQMLKNRRAYDEYEDFFEVNIMKPETLNLPENLSKERLRQLNENIHKFKQAMKIGELSDTTLEDRKQNCVGGVKQIIKNYKQLVESQDQLLNKVILKSKEFKAAEMAQLENRYARINQSNQFEKAKRFVEEQSQYLEAKNMELEKTRKMMQNAMKKAEDNKKQALRQRQAFQSQALEIRRSIEVLPSMIEEQLARGQY